MEAVRLKTAIQTLGHTAALKDGTITSPHFVFDFEDVPVIIKAFRRMVRGQEFDVSEMALTTYICARAHNKPFTALPIFPVRAFHHGAILYNTRLGIKDPKDLEGGKVGVNRGYTVTTGVWARAALQHDHGVDLGKITWVLSGDEHVEEFRPPANVVSMPAGTTLEDMLVKGEIAAAIGVSVDHPDVKPLIADAEAVGLAAFKRTGYYPINHTVVVKDSVLAANPGLAAELFGAFAAAKRLYMERLRGDQIAEPSKADRLYRRILDMGVDPLPYGIEPNRAMLEAIIGYAGEQGILSTPVTPESLFARGVAKHG